MYSSKLLPVVAKEAIGSECNPTTLVTVNMGYTINGKTILAGINAIFEPQKLTALMGAYSSDLHIVRHSPQHRIQRCW